MKKFVSMLFVGIAMLAQAEAGEVKVTWQDPEKYTDIRPSNEIKADFKDRVIKELDLVFVDLAKKLPEGYQWDITVTDVDLAGDVRPFFHHGMNDVRVIKELYWPRMSFSYELKDAAGKSVASGKEDVKDMNFLMRRSLSTGTGGFQYEEQMLRDWFRRQQRDKIFP